MEDTTSQVQRDTWDSASQAPNPGDPNPGKPEPGIEPPILASRNVGGTDNASRYTADGYLRPGARWR